MIIRNTRELGGFLRQAREDAGFTQAGLAETLGVRRQRVLYLERGEGQLQLAFIFAAMYALGISISLERNANAVPTRKPGSKARGAKAPPYSIDDIADGGTT
jgi:transcriptional regulator with XRE-family HTH domain